MQARPIADRLRESVVVDPESGCWLWQKSISEWGYPQMGTGSRTTGDRRIQYAHRISYEQFCGPIPEGFVVDHLCQVKRCINPEHLEPVTEEENIRRSPAAANSGQRRRARTMCPKGHPYTGDNVIRKPGGRRQCRTCTLESTRRWRAAIAD